MRKYRFGSFMSNVVISAAHSMVRFYLRFVRLIIINEDEPVNCVENGGKIIVALWHQRFFGVVRYAERFSKYKPSAIVSRSRDGEIISRVIIRLGYRPIRGSSSRGGKEALAAIVEDLNQNLCAIHAVDGPQGPKGVVKPGLIRMAQLSRATIFPLYISVERAWILGSWDRFLIPKPLSRVLVRWGDPIVIPDTIETEQFEIIRLHVENTMIEGHARDDLDWKWEKPL